MRYVVDIKKADEDKLIHGEKGVELSSITSLGLNVPPGFIITTEAYFEFINQNNLRQKVKHLINAGAERKIKKLFLDSEIPEGMVEKIFKAYRGLGLFKDEPVLIYSSVNSVNDFFKYSPIKIKGEAVLLQSVKELWASYFDEEHFLHRKHRGLSHFRTGIAIIIQKDLKSDKFGSIIIGKGNIQIDTKDKLSEKENLQLLEIGQKIASLHYFSKKINWIIAKKEIYVTGIALLHNEALQTSLPTEISNTDSAQEEQLENKSIGGIATGVVKIIDNKKDILSIKNGDVVIISNLKDYYQLKSLKHAKAVVVNNDIENQHIKMVLSRMGFPVVIGTYDESFRNGMIVTVDGTKGQVYQGEFRLN